MKNTLEWSNSWKTKGEEQVSDLADRMVEITVMEQKKKNEKKWGQLVWETSGTLNVPTFTW